MTTTETAVVVGVSDEQLELLIEGRWFDDDGRTPGWQRWIESSDGEKKRQLVCPLAIGWMADFGDMGEEHDSLDEALAWCDTWAVTYKILPVEGIISKQEERFAEFAKWRS